MGKFIIKRVLISIVVVFLVSVFAFSLMHILPGDPARLSLGEEASQEDVDALREELNLNKPVLEQYFIWISGIFRGDFGQSIQYHRPVLDIMQERLPRTVAIGLPTLVISTIIGIAFGIISAIRRGKFIDQVITFLATIGMGTPVFWIGILGIYLFAMRLGILPIQGFTSPTEDFANTSIRRSFRYSVFQRIRSRPFPGRRAPTCWTSSIRIISARRRRTASVPPASCSSMRCAMR